MRDVEDWNKNLIVEFRSSGGEARGRSPQYWFSLDNHWRQDRPATHHAGDVPTRR